MFINMQGFSYGTGQFNFKSFTFCPSGHEGRAGMAAVIVRLGHEFDGKALFEHVVTDLPAYARPVFIRIQVRPRL